MSITVLAPAYNEELVIEPFVRAVLEVMGPDDELLVVDDGSTDGTLRALETLRAADPRVRIVVHETNQGLGAGLRTGFREARNDIVVTMDADLSHPLALLPDLVDAARQPGVAAAFGSRFVPGGGMEGVPLLRRAISAVANVVLRVLFRTAVRDLTTGYRAYRRTAVDDLELTGTGFETQLEISVRLVGEGRRIVELPMVLSVRAAGESKMKYFRLIRRYGAMVGRLVAVRWDPRGRAGRK